MTEQLEHMLWTKEVFASGKIKMSFVRIFYIRMMLLTMSAQNYILFITRQHGYRSIKSIGSLIADNSAIIEFNAHNFRYNHH